MRQTGLTFEKDIYNLVKESVLKTAIKGSFYREGMRPLNAKTEDAVVSFMTGVDDQIQIGVVNVNVYVPDIDSGKYKVKDIGRCNTIEIACSDMIESISSDNYKFSLGAIIQTFPAVDIEQHFVNVKLKFQYITF